MFITSVYHYIPRQRVTVLDINSVRKHAPVYSKPLVLHKGVDNKLSFQFLNNEQKPIDITGKNILCRIINYSGTKVLISKSLELDFALTGIASLNLTADEIDFINPQKAFYSLEIPKDDKSFPVYLDQSAGARGNMSIVDSILPAFVSSTLITIPTSEPEENYNSSVYSATSLINTFQITLTEFTGNIIVEGSSVINQNWYEVDPPRMLEDFSGTIGITIKGYHPFFRLRFEDADGMVSNILVR